MKPTERQITHSIIEYLNYQGYFCWRENVGAMELPNKNGTTRMVKFGKAGISDIIGLSKKGRFIAVEVKRPETMKRVTPAQDSFLQMIRDYGGIGIVASSVEDVQKQLKV